LDPGFIVPIKDSIDGAYSSSINNAAGSFDNPYVNWNANGFRLPTEGEWQFAASYIDGTNWYMYNYASGATANYNDAAATGLVAWYSANTTVPHNVGEKNPDALGIYDMSGNVMEWCWDWSNTYPTSAQTDYRGPDNGDGREIRGGYYNNSSASYLQIGFRQPYNPYQEYYGLGFRLAKTY
jgi:formylglycine-generating enzyme required for sulfatase activity